MLHCNYRKVRGYEPIFSRTFHKFNSLEHLYKALKITNDTNNVSELSNFRDDRL